MRGPLAREIRQSLWLLALTGLSMGFFVGLGALAVWVFG